MPATPRRRTYYARSRHRLRAPPRSPRSLQQLLRKPTGEERGCNAAHIAKGIKSGAETLSGIAVDDEGELEWFLIDFVWT